MPNDEQAIRDLFTSWRNAAAAGDLQRLLGLMADDVVFLRPGQAPMQGKQAFAGEFEAGLQRYHIEAHGEIKDLRIGADLAYCWNHLSVMITPLREGVSMYLRGNTLTVLQRQADGRWLVLRDANMLSPEPAAAAAPQ